jgi:cell wall-associated NlpC family hydrolase
VSSYEHRITTTSASVELVRKQHTLKEPKGSASTTDGDAGDQNFLPDVGGDAGQAGSADTATAGSPNPTRERMVQFALAQRGDAYVWGGNGPSGWDCSGLVQGATAHAGKPLGKPSRSQWARCQAAGVTISVADALRIRGALLFRIDAGEYDHVAISLGNGSTIEAMGSAYGVLVAGNAAGRTWTGAALWI